MRKTGFYEMAHMTLSVFQFLGYREAECGWIVVDDQSDEQATEEAKIRQALFLVIYAPRRGILEVPLFDRISPPWHFLITTHK